MAEIPIVYIVDDDDPVRVSVTFLLECAGIKALGFPSAAALLKAAPKPMAGCIVSDIRMPGMDGLEMQRLLPEHGIHLPIIFITGHGDVPIAVDALKNGAADFLEKPFEDETLLTAIRKALVQDQASREQAGATAGIEARLKLLTPREREVFAELATGSPNKVIGHRLGMSPRTVEVHRARIMEKMAARNLPELVRMDVALKHR
jgi:two-component system response regulator FixJ